jgi:hypothetical protein
MVTVTQLLVEEGFIDTTWYDEYGRDRGTYVHKAVHLYDTDELDEERLDPVLVPYLTGWKKFLKESNFVVIDSEVRLNNGQFTGKPDKVGLLNGLPAILDNKSGSIEPWVALQLAGYEILKGSPHKRIAVRLKPDGTYSLKEFKDRQDRQIFLAALACYQWKQNNLKGR